MKDHATIGDALIFMTKTVVGGSIVIALAVTGAWAYMVRQDNQVSALRVQKASLEQALATEQALSREALNQVDILNRQMSALRGMLEGRPLTDDEFDVVAACPTSEPCKPWERDWRWFAPDRPSEPIPAPPPGFVIDEE